MSFRSILKEVPATLKLAVPIFLGMLGHMLIQLTDTLMLGRYGTVELAASAFASSILMLVLYGGLGFGQAVAALGSQALGAKDEKRARGIYHLAAVSGFFYSCAGVLLALALLPAFDHMGQAPLVAASAKPFALLIAVSFIPTILFQTLRNYYEALKRPWVPFAYMAGLVVANLFFNWVLIYGNLGFPALGIVGSGLGTLLARTLLAVSFFAFARRKGEVLHDAQDRKALPLDALPKILTIAATSGVQMVATTLAYVVGGIWIGTIGVASLAGSRIIGMLDATVYMLPVGLSYAMSNRIGRAKGENDPERVRTIYRGGFLIAAAVGAIVSVAMIVWRQDIVHAFTPDAAVAAVAGNLILIAALFRVFDAVDCVSIGALRGLGDVVVPALAYLGFYWVVAMPLAWHFAFNVGLGAEGVWWGYCVGIMLAGVFMAGRFLWSTRRLENRDSKVEIRRAEASTVSEGT